MDDIVSNYHRKAFLAAFEYASMAYQNNEVPVGAVIVKDKNIIAGEHNRIIERHDSTAHAEILAIKKACTVTGNERLINCELFTTKEPCAMCSGAIILSRISRVYFLSLDEKLPAMRAILALKGHNHYPQWEYVNIPDIPAGELLTRFFREKRQNS